MSRMNLVRIFISALLLTLIAISIAGWVWAGGRPSPAMEGSRFALTLCGLSSLGCLGVLWAVRRSEPDVR